VVAIHERLDDRRRYCLSGTKDLESVGAARRKRLLTEDEADACFETPEYLLTVLRRPCCEQHAVEFELVDHRAVIVEDVLAPVARRPVLGHLGASVATGDDRNVG
jgi:hypothetical protein